MSDSVRVTIQHFHEVPAFNGGRGYCSRMGRVFAELHGLDWAAFVQEGIDSAVLEATGDALAARLVEYARSQARTVDGNG